VFFLDFRNRFLFHLLMSFSKALHLLAKLASDRGWLYRELRLQADALPDRLFLGLLGGLSLAFTALLGRQGVLDGLLAILGLDAKLSSLASRWTFAFRATCASLAGAENSSKRRRTRFSRSKGTRK